MTEPEHLLQQLRSTGQGDDAAIPMGETALCLAALDHKGLDLEPYRRHLVQLASDAASSMKELRRGMSESEAAARVLADTISTRHGYAGDNETFDDPQNADMIRVIDRRRGLPVALGIIYLDVAHRLGLPAHGLNTPGHFLLQIGEGEQARVLDPFNGGVLLSFEELRPWPPAATIADTDYGPVSRREVLLRLLNNVRTRALAGKDMVRTLTILERMVLVSPKQAELWLDLSRANESVGNLKSAIRAAQTCQSLADDESVFGREATFAVTRLRRHLN
jgi:regulator of sirC expression with transglutaminase-like and TPR domain